MKCMKVTISLVAGLVALAAAVCAIVIFQEELTKLYGSCKEYCCKTFSKKKSEDEYADFADV